jgi:hypothetical protein
MAFIPTPLSYNSPALFARLFAFSSLHIIRQGDPVFLKRGGIAAQLLSVYILLKYLTVSFVVALV